jgi:hypothetical protein
MPSKRSDIGSDPHEGSGSDFSWHNAQTFWIIMIIAFTIFILHITYKLTKAIRRRRLLTSEVHQLEERRIHGEIAAETTLRIRGLQVPSRARTRRRRSSSDVSVLPRYEQHGQDMEGDEDMEVEKRGRYTYPVGRWPKPRGIVNASVNVKGRYHEDAIVLDEDALSPDYHRL